MLNLQPKRKPFGSGGAVDSIGSLSSRLFRSTRSLAPRVRWVHITWLYLVWLFLIHYFERTVVYSTIRQCQWEQWEQWPAGSDPHHSAVIGDPQIVDAYSYPTRPWLLMKITTALADNYLHRNYAVMNELLAQHSTLFVGDLFDGGREWDDPYWFAELERFHGIFNHQQGNRVYWQVPGNHDIGFGDGINYDVYKRFRAYFGEADTWVTLGNHSVVLLDVVSWADTESHNVSKNALEFIDYMEQTDHPAKDLPRIVISHVPMYRSPDKQTCGPLRESHKRFPLMRGKQYQTAVEYQYSREVLDRIKPKLILSGDDHDYCHIRHPIDKEGLKLEDFVFAPDAQCGVDYADEITIKSSAMTGGIQRPAVQLLSLWNPDPVAGAGAAVADPLRETGSQTVLHDTYESHLCYMPDFMRPIKYYAFWAVFSLVTLLCCSVFPRPTSHIQGLLQNALTALGDRDRASVLPSKLSPKKVSPKKVGQRVLHLLLSWQVTPQHSDWRAFVAEAAVLFTAVWVSFYRTFNSI